MNRLNIMNLSTRISSFRFTSVRISSTRRTAVCALLLFGASANAVTVTLSPSAGNTTLTVGQTFTIFRSDDGLNWTTNGTTTWPASRASSGTVW